MEKKFLIVLERTAEVLAGHQTSLLVIVCQQVHPLDKNYSKELEWSTDDSHKCYK